MKTKYIRSILLGSAFICMSNIAHAQANNTSDTEPGAETARQETIVITGTRRAGRTVEDSAVPIDVLTSEELIGGATDTNDILKTLIPSYNVQQISVGGGSPFIRPPTLRGLPPDQILVLVNGKRRHRSSRPKSSPPAPYSSKK